jgi:hypothetical protein
MKECKIPKALKHRLDPCSIFKTLGGGINDPEEQKK